MSVRATVLEFLRATALAIAVGGERPTEIACKLGCAAGGKRLHLGIMAGGGRLHLGFGCHHGLYCVAACCSGVGQRSVWWLRVALGGIGVVVSGRQPRRCCGRSTAAGFDSSTSR